VSRIIIDALHGQNLEKSDKRVRNFVRETKKDTSRRRECSKIDSKQIWCEDLEWIYLAQWQKT